MKKYSFILLIIFISCQEEITLDLSDVSNKLVVEGSIEPGFPPYVILTRNQGYFDQIDTETYNSLFIIDAEVQVFKTINGEIIPKKLIPYISDSLVIYTVEDYDFVSGINNYSFSQKGETYSLKIFWNGDTITSTTTIPEPTPLDSLWVEKNELSDLYFESDIRAWYSDPINVQNNILIKSKMLKHYEQDSSTCIVDSINDPFLLLLDCGPDVLINGEGFETYFPRPIKNGFPSGKYHSEHYEECKQSNDSIFIKNDIVLIKFCQIDEPSMRFWRGVVRQSGFNSNPFTEPMNLASNINGALGVWTGYGAVYYKVPIIQETTIFEQYEPKIQDIL